MLYDIVEAAEAQVEQWLEKKATQVSTFALGLDARAGIVWVCDEAIVVHEGAKARLDYYGGFEYVSKEQVQQVGKYVIYWADWDDSDRVRACVEHWEERKEAA
jgi:hypothetical protein